MIASQLINIGSTKLKKMRIQSHLLDSELILSNVLKTSREKMLTTSEKKVSKNEIDNFNKLLARRLRCEPMAYIFKEKEFWSKSFLIDKNALIPRPETELLVEKISKYFKNKKVFILDIGTGSGCILLSLLDEIKNSSGIGIDISKKALDVAIKNKKKLKIKKKLKFLNRSLNEIFGYKFDIVVSNPPYICTHQIKNLSEDIKKYEPRIALDGGKDGLDVIKKVIYKTKTILKRKGMLALELGKGQYREVSKILKLHGFKKKFLIKDYQNNIRCIITLLE